MAWRDRYSQMMVVWAILSKIFLVLQGIKIYYNKAADGVSFYAYTLFLLGALLWFVYGAFVAKPASMAMVVGAILNFIGGAIILAGIVLYGDGPSRL